MAPTFPPPKIGRIFRVWVLLLPFYSEHQKRSQNGRVFHGWTFLQPKYEKCGQSWPHFSRLGSSLFALPLQARETQPKWPCFSYFACAPYLLLPKHEKGGRIAHVFCVWVAVASPSLPNLNITHMAVVAMFIYIYIYILHNEANVGHV